MKRSIFHYTMWFVLLQGCGAGTTLPAPASTTPAVTASSTPEPILDSTADSASDESADGATEPCRHRGQCILDASASACVPGINTTRPGLPGPQCACVEGACVWFEAPPVACSDHLDCAVENLPAPHAVAAEPRRSALPEPCVEAPRDARCVDDVCKVVMWRC